MFCLPFLVGMSHGAQAASGPDLTVDSIWLEENSDPGQPVEQVAPGDQFLIVVSVKNVGTSSASGYYLDVYYDSEYGRGCPDTIAPGETQVWYVGPLTAVAGTHTTKWIVDPELSRLFVIEIRSTSAGPGPLMLEGDTLALLVLLQRFLQRRLVFCGHLFSQGVFYCLKPFSDENKLLLKNGFGHG
jgi:hypothetical protein